MRRLFVLACLLLALPLAAAQDPPPTDQQVREATHRLRLISLAVLSYESVNGHYPNNVYKDGKALLSWRVLVAPYLDGAPPGNPARPTEAWDSPANKTLLEKMPKVFAPVRGKAKVGETFYRGFVTPRGPFGPRAGKGLKVLDFRDGTSTTVLVAEAGEAVPWTKPDDLDVPAKGPLPKLGGMLGGAPLVILADGSVMRLRADLDPTELRRLIDPADGSTVDLNRLRSK